MKFEVTIGNKVSFSPDAFGITGGAFGTVGHAEITTSRALLSTLGIDLLSMTSGNPSDTEVGIIVTNPDNSLSKLFGGEHMATHWDYDSDSVTLHCRDWSGVLVDQKRILTSVNGGTSIAAPLAPGQQSPTGINTTNQTVSQLVAQIATQWGLTFVNNFDPNNDPNYGTFYGTDTTLMSIPKSVWGILNEWARDLGYEVYVTPTKQLVFGIPGAGVAMQPLSYNTSPVPSGAVPCRHLTIEHNPRRNSTFRVLVSSYDPLKGQPVVGRATVVSQNLNASGLEPGTYVGQDAITVDAQFKDFGDRVQLYSFNVDGLTQEQATTKAQAIANDISKREILLQAEFDGLASIVPTQMVSVSGNVDSIARGYNYYISSFHHSFKMPRGAHKDGMGWLTTIRCLNLPIQQHQSLISRGKTL